MTIDKLFASLSIDVDTQSVQKFVKTVTGAAKEIKKKADEVCEALDKIASSATDAAEKAGKKTEVAIKPLNKLEKKANEAASAIGSAVEKVSEFMESSIEKANELATEKGLLYDITEEELKQADKYTKSMAKAEQSVELMKAKLALGLSPALTEITDSFNEWLEANKELVAEGLTHVIQACTSAIKIIANTFRAIDRVVSATIGWKAAIMIIVGALAIFKRAMLTAFLTNPIGWVIAAISGLIWLIDDLMTFLEGGESTFGDFWGAAIKWIEEAISWWEEWLESVEETLNEIKDAFSRAFSRLTELTQETIDDIKATWESIKTFFSTWTNWLKLLFIVCLDYVVAAFFAAVEWVKDAWQTAIDGIKAMWEGIKAFFSTWTDWLKTLFSVGLALIESIWESLKTSVKEIFDKLGNLASEAVERVKAAFSGAIDFLTSPFQSAVNIIKGLFDDAGGDADKFIADIEQTFNNVIDAITKPFKNAFAEIMDIYEKTIGKISGAWDSVKGGASGVWDSIKGGTSGIYDSAKGWIGLGDATSAPNPQNASGNVNNRSEVNIHSEGVKAQITINATNADEARRGVEAGLNAGNREYTQVLASLGGVGAQ